MSRYVSTRATKRKPSKTGNRRSGNARQFAEFKLLDKSYAGRVRWHPNSLMPLLTPRPGE